ncbi:PDZ domain-containing protein [Lactobacillus sp. ESL0684]|uniref:SepM family pheromone-processing serine protease n=1 Tax=unclassified Lactobacillus TaxID=2620435 RepID=UPI0023F74D13|nr:MULTISPECIES: SepM family pheromone-processing serine protease [unclassified Lactobacillus]WEV40614.1 PDZ domain-containing protein [Lactobacillus sp. ESL0681]WEV42866.1 PDZ domain-containing protein [Lactobacillus sp. ESL0684]
MKKTKGSHHIRNWLLVIVTFLLIVIGLSWPTNYYIEMPGSAVNTSQFVKSKDPKPNNYYLVTVSSTSKPATVLQYLLSYTQKFATRVSAKEMLGGSTSSQYEELQNWYMETSQQNAIYCAAKKAHLNPKLHYQGVYVMQVQKNSSFKQKLQIGDTILGADGHRFHSTQAMMKYFRHQRIGSQVNISVLRNQHRRNFTGKIVKVAGTNQPGIGIQLVERVKVETNPKIDIDAGAIGGPSAGLMFALTSYQVFTGHNLAKGHKIAGTGTITATGKVGIIGGVDKKVVAADQAGAEVFFAPTDTTGVKKNASNYLEAKKTAKQIKTKMKVVPIATFDDAVKYLKTNY